MSKSENAAIEKLNRCIEKCSKVGVFHAGVTLRKSKNSCLFSGHPVLLKALSKHSETLIPCLEKAAANVDNLSKDLVKIGHEDYSTQTVLPPMPAPLTSLPCTSVRAYVSAGMHLLTGVRDSRQLYKQERPEWWPKAIPFQKPCVVPSSFQRAYGTSANSEWSRCLRRVIFEMHLDTRQDFRKNVDGDGWRSFCQK